MPDEIKEAIRKVCKFCRENENFWRSACTDEESYCPVATLWNDFIEKEEE